MQIDERIKDLSEKRAKSILRKAIANIAERQTCGSCVMQIICGEEASADKCMCNTFNLFSLQVGPTADEDEEEGVIYYDPETMQIVD